MNPKKNLLNNGLRRSGACLSLLVITFCGQTLHADWVGDTSADWNDPLNWPSNTLPATNSGLGIQMVGAPAGAPYTAKISADSSFSPGEIVIGGYRIEGTNDLGTFDQLVYEVDPVSDGLPALNAGWSYRGFRLNGNIGGATPRGPKGFLRAVVVDESP